MYDGVTRTYSYRNENASAFRAKARRVLAHLNAEALRVGSPVIQAEGSLLAFVPVPPYLSSK
jgi:hypothetical protein